MKWTEIYFKILVIKEFIGIGVFGILILILMYYLVRAVWSASKK